jgi:hypothetical protein
VSGDDWLRALHVLAAFGVVGVATAYAIVAMAARRLEVGERTLALADVAGGARAVLGPALLATAVLGVWLVFADRRYGITEPWILAAIISWFAVGAFGHRPIVRSLQQADRPATGPAGGAPASTTPARPPVGWLPPVGAGLAATAAVVLMIWKPGA